MISQENDNLVIVDWEPNTEFKIELPLGTSFSTGPTRDPFGEKKVLIGILGELERLIFELNNRVKALEIIFENRF